MVNKIDKIRALVSDGFIDIWKGPLLFCPSCDQYSMSILHETFHTKQTKEVDFLWEHFMEYEDIPGSKFIAMLECKVCKENVAIAGDVVSKIHNGDCGSEVCYEEYIDAMQDGVEDMAQHRHNFYYIKHIDRCFSFILVPDVVGDDFEIMKALTSSFELFWKDSGSCGNKIRVALERFMDLHKIPIKKLNKNGKNSLADLHWRIEEFGKIENGKFSSVSDHLMSLKLLGNKGSHKGSVKQSDLLDAYDIIEDAFFEIYEKENKQRGIKQKITQLNKP